MYNSRPGTEVLPCVAVADNGALSLRVCTALAAERRASAGRSGATVTDHSRSSDETCSSIQHTLQLVSNGLRRSSQVTQ